MADEKQLEILKNGVEIWNRWREENPYEIIDLNGADLRSKNLIGANLGVTDLRHTRPYYRIFPFSTLLKYSDSALIRPANLRGADFSGAKLKGADLMGADLRGAIFDSDTQLAGAMTKRCTVDSYLLEQLEDYGGLTKGNRMDMNIVDGVVDLRMSYSGFQQWIHLTALAIFIFPYAWFVVSHWSIAKFLSSDSCGPLAYMPLWEALRNYIYNGGLDWQTGMAIHPSFFAFLFMFIYNILRGALLWKTKRLELEKESSGLKVKFSLEESKWGVAFNWANKLFVVSLIIALLNTAHFFTQEIPLPPVP